MNSIARFLAILAVSLALTSAVRAEEKCGADLSLPAKARDVVREYATAGGKIAYHGISASRIDSSTFFVVVDFGDNRDMMMLLVRQFFDDSGHGYWKASAVDPTTAGYFGNRLKFH